MPLFTKLLTAKTVQGFGNSIFWLYLCKRKQKGYLKPRVSCTSGFFDKHKTTKRMLKIRAEQRPITKIGTSEKELRYALQLLSSGQISEKEVVKFCSKHTNIPQATVRAVLDSCCQTIEYHLALGYSVKLGDVGTFYPTISYKSVHSNTDAGLAQLENVNIRFRPNSSLIEVVNKAEKELTGVYKIVDYEKGFYEEVGTRKLDGNDDGTPPGESGGNNNGGSGDLVG